MIFLPISYAVPKETRDLRLYIRHREWLVCQRTQTKNRVQPVLASFNLVNPVRDLFGVKGREFLDENLSNLHPSAQRVIEDNLALIDHLNAKIKALEEDLQGHVSLGRC